MKIKPLALSLLSGILLSTAWLGLSGMVLLVAFLPLLYLNDYFLRNKSAYLPIVFWFYSFIAMLVWNALSTWWIWNATQTGALFAILCNSFLMSLVWLLVHYAHRLKGAGFGAVFTVFAWISFEYLHFKWDMSWPWLTLGNGLANDIRLIQWYEYTGVFGGTLWILLINLLLWDILKKYAVTYERIRISQPIIFFLILLLPVAQSLIKYRLYNEVPDPVNVVVLQPNIDPYNDKFDRLTPLQQHQKLIELANKYSNDAIDLYIGPETALHDVWQNEVESSNPVRLIRSFLETETACAAFITGAMTYKVYESGSESTATARKLTGSSSMYDAFNTALFIKTNEPVQLYHKSKLVSGVEKMPFNRYLKFLEKLVVDLGGTTGTLATQNDPVVFSHNGTVMGVPICYESGYGEYVSQFIKKGAAILIVITNDGWWDNTPGYRQHLSYSRIQAIQFRRSIARSANTGISCFINQKGVIEQQTQWWVETAIAGKLNRNNTVTFYTQHGDYIARIGLFMFVLMGLSLLVTRLKQH